MCGKFAVGAGVTGLIVGVVDDVEDGVVVEVDEVVVTLGVVFVLELLSSDELGEVLEVATFAGFDVASLSASLPNDHLAAENIPNNNPPTTMIPRTVMRAAVGRDTPLVALPSLPILVISFFRLLQKLCAM